MRSISHGHYYMGITNLILDTQRNDLVDFSFDIRTYSLRLYYVENNRKPNFLAYFKSFQNEVWCSLALYICGLIFGYVGFELFLGEANELWKLAKLHEHFMKAGNFVLRSIIGKRMSWEPDRISIRLSFFVVTCVGFMLITLYRAMLVAFVAVEEKTVPINSLDEIGDSEYRVAVPKNSALENLFLYEKPDSVEEKLNKTDKLIRFEGVLQFITHVNSKKLQIMNIAEKVQE